MQRCQVFKGDLVPGVFRFLVVDGADLEQGEVAFAVLGRAYLAVDGVAGAQTEAPDLAGRDVDIVRPGQVGTVCRAQKSETVLQDFQDAAAKDVFTLLGMCLEYGEDNVLLARACCPFGAYLLRNFNQFGCGF